MICMIFLVFFCFYLNYKPSHFPLSHVQVLISHVQVWIPHVQAWICFYNTNINLYIYFLNILFVLHVLFLQYMTLGIRFLNDVPFYIHLTSQ